MTNTLVSGYKAAELGIFKDSDPKIPLIKKIIKKDLLHLLDEGLSWLIFTGNLGFEYWVLEEALLLQSEFHFQIATLFCFENHGQNWNEANQEKLRLFKQVDFVKYSYPVYSNPIQLKYYNDFLIEHSDKLYLFYEKEYETNLKFLLAKAEEKKGYSTKRLTFERLNDSLNE